MMMRTLGSSGIKTSAIGLGCWAIGGPFRDLVHLNGDPAGWGKVDDTESIRAIHCALDVGINFFDTADNYGCGHSERIIGQALAGRRHQAVIATKFGHIFNEETREITGVSADPEYIVQACEASLRRLNTDYIDLYQFHLGMYDADEAVTVRDVLEQLVAMGKIRCYGWSTDDSERAQVFSAGKYCVAIQHRLNVFHDNAALLDLCAERNLASINRSPLASGILTGKFTVDSQFPDDDGRFDWNFREGALATRLQQFNQIRDVLTRAGRTTSQGALGWLLARSDTTIPIPGFKTVNQVTENIKALEYGPLSDAEMREIAAVLGRKAA